MIRLEGYDDCILGIGEACDREPALVYSEELMIKKIMEMSDCDPEEAAEDLYYNIKNCFLGEGNPIFVAKIKPYELEELSKNSEIGWIAELKEADEE